MRRLKILIADDHPVVLYGVRKTLLNQTAYELVGEATQASELLSLIEQHAPDIVISDYDMPGDAVHGDGLRLIGYMRRRFPDIKVIILTVVQSPVIIDELRALGVSAVLSKLEELSEILAALRAVEQGMPYYGTTPPSIHCGRTDQSVDQKIQSLTGKELEVLRQLMAGHTVTAIASQLQRSVKTISAQKISAMRKLGITSDHELVMFCLQHRLFSAA